MMRVLLALGLVVAVAACDSKEDKAAADARDIAAVEAANHAPPPRIKLALQPILFPDIQQARLYDKGCAFVPDGGGLGAVLMTDSKRAAIKTGDAMVILASDPGSAAMPAGTWSRYTGKAYALTLTRSGDGDESFPGKLVVTDPADQVAYEASGLVQCKG
jgi:hypothetical protein